MGKVGVALMDIQARPGSEAPALDVLSFSQVQDSMFCTSGKTIAPVTFCLSCCKPKSSLRSMKQCMGGVSKWKESRFQRSGRKT
jgi:hypothetical protein